MEKCGQIVLIGFFLSFCGRNLISAAEKVAISAHISAELNRSPEARIPFPLLPPGSLPAAMPISNVALEQDSDLLKGYLKLE